VKQKEAAAVEAVLRLTVTPSQLTAFRGFRYQDTIYHIPYPERIEISMGHLRHWKSVKESAMSWAFLFRSPFSVVTSITESANRSSIDSFERVRWGTQL